jgi:queuosine precursor transporter
MPNEILWLLFLVTDLLLVIAVYRLFGRLGLVAYIVMAIITCNLQVQVLVSLFGFEVTLGNILYGSIFLCTDLLSENHGRKAANQAVWMGFVAVVLMTLFMRIALYFKPLPYDAALPHLQALFASMPRIVIGSLAAYLCSQLFDVWAFHRIRERTAGRWLWLRNNMSTIVSQFLDISLFTLLALAPLPVLGIVSGFESWSTVVTVWWTAYVIKLIVAVADTPFVYWGRAIERRRNAAGENG